ncbi:MAG: hypothetical protein D4R98_06510 [Comamonadaceae bacterium]|nr:MAG: hypothetical protein D4R98_06510 [Comamonadaceae bacterium]
MKNPLLLKANWLRERRLSIIFHLTFIALFGAIILSTCFFYRRGYDVFIRESELSLGRKLDLIESYIRDSDGHVLLSNLDRTKAERPLGITVIPVPPRTFYESYEPWDALRPCRLVFNNLPDNVRPLDVCAAVEDKFDNGRYLYLIIRYYDDKILMQKNNTLLGDHIRLEITMANNNTTRWLLVPQASDQPLAVSALHGKQNSRQSPSVRSIALAAKRQKIKRLLKAVPSNAFLVTTYKADAEWSPEPKPEVLRVAGGSLIFPPIKSSERSLFFRMEYKLLEPSLSDNPKATPWPPKGLDKIKLRLSLFNTDKPGIKPKLENTTFNGDGDFAGRAMLSLDSAIGSHLDEGERAEIIKHNKQLFSSAGLQQIRADYVPNSDSAIIKLLANWLFSQLPNRAVIVGPRQMQGFTELTLRLTNDNKLASRQWMAVAEQFSISLMTLLVLVGMTYAAVFFLVINRIQTLAFEAKNAAHHKDGAITFSSLDQNDEIGCLARSFRGLIQTIQADEQLRQAEIMANATRKEAVLREVGHEIRSPLQGLVAILPPDHRGRGYVDRMLRAVDHLLGATAPDNNLSNMPLTPEKIDLNHFLREIEENAHYSGIDNLTFGGTDGSVEVMVDPSALEDVVTHILNNGARYRTQATPLEMHLSIEEGGAFIAINNTGPRISEDKLEEIFQYGVSSERDNGQNLGQGLFVVRNYISRMSGSVIAKNMANGVSFEIRLPLANGA